jgi:hypothetical protein
VTLRRQLVDPGPLERSADGHAYRVGFPVQPIAFDLEVDEIHVRSDERRLPRPGAPAAPTRTEADLLALRRGGSSPR